MKLKAVITAPVVVSIVSLAVVPAAHADDTGKITTFCGHTTRVSADSASMRVVAYSSKQPSGTLTLTVRRVPTGKVIRSMAASFAGAERTEFAFRALARGTYKVVFSTSESRFFSGCAATERLVVRRG